ncbi:hypothetical protein L7F22_008872 [Adiantum nelumboides]|nr:hypothetical protein [Adiantum nelumboides]
MFRIIGTEEILVKCLLDLENPTMKDHAENASNSDAAGSDDSDDLGVSQRVTLNVQISKKSFKDDKPQIAFLCSYAKGEPVSLEDIAYLGDSTDQDHPYSGPCFSELDGKLKQVFQNVIKTRGISANLAKAIMENLTVQYQDEYLDWLKKISEFLVR